MWSSETVRMPATFSAWWRRVGIMWHVSQYGIVPAFPNVQNDAISLQS